MSPVFAQLPRLLDDFEDRRYGRLVPRTVSGHRSGRSKVSRGKQCVSISTSRASPAMPARVVLCLSTCRPTMSSLSTYVAMRR